MGEKPDSRDRPPEHPGAVPVGAGPERPERARRGRLDLSLPQVAGSAVAAVVAAKLAANLGVYGTILGAGVVSVLATCGGSIFQHFFRRTGEQLRGAAVQVRPRARQVPVTGTGRPVPETFRPPGEPLAPLPGPPPGPPLDGGGLPDSAVPGVPASVPPGVPEADAPRGDGDVFGAATVHRARGRRRRPLIAAGLVFAVAMGGITAYEAAAGHSLSGGGTGTTIGNAFTGTHPAPGPAEQDSTTGPSSSPSPSSSSSSSSSSPAPDGDGGDRTGQSPERTADPAPTSGRTGQDEPDRGATGGSGGRDGQPGGSTGSPTPTPTPSPSGGTGTPQP